MTARNAFAASVLAIGMAGAGAAFAQSLDQQFTTQLDGIRTNLSSGQSAGKITAQDATSINQRLDNLVTLKGQYASDGLSDDEYRQLKTRLDVVNDDVNRKIKGFAVVKEGAGASAGYDQQLVAQMNDIKAQIGTAQSAGKLSASQVQSLNSRLGNIDTLKGQYASDGITTAEFSNVKQRLDVLTDDVRKQSNAG